MAQALFVTTEDVARYTALNGNVDVDKFIQYVKIAQDVHIQNFLGTDLFEKISSDIVSGTLAGIYSTLVTDHVKWMTLHWAMVEFLPFSAYTIANKGVFKHGAESSTSVDKNEVDFLIEKQRDIAQHYTKRFIDFMCFNSSSFPEYDSNTDGDLSPDRKVNYTNWFL